LQAPTDFGGVADLNRSAAHKFISVLLNRAEPQQDNRLQLIHVLRRLCKFSHNKQLLLMTELSKHLPFGSSDRLDRKFLEVVAKEKDKTDRLTAEEHERIAAQEKEKEEVAEKKKQLKTKKNATTEMLDYMLQHRRLAAQQVLDPEQLLVLLEDHVEMEYAYKPVYKQTILAKSQKALQDIVDKEQQKQMAVIVQDAMKLWKEAGGLPPVRPMDREIPNEVIEHLIKQQYVCAQQVMDQHQFGVFKDGWSNVIVQTSVAGKQAALQQIQKVVAPLLSLEQKEETLHFMKIQMILYNKVRIQYACSYSVYMVNAT